ncbi:MAG TPA: YkvA family protein [Noviherbaspirillum sp.]|uniref:YkvA family protein n=1 Tax=Noviherbaspirillum sp. TaxID=1926288 RepID=UPI002B473EC1|nr:YkvA family protein [Noviherbaspirillum sp.]HJV87513.1 YkvA family protein [Noviherbaspirillum sp.]
MFRLGRFIRAVGRDILVLWYACRNPATPLLVKIAALLIALYVISPIDLVPDWFVLLGWTDDITLLALGIPALLRFLPEHVLHEARSAADGLLPRSRS